MSKHIVDTLIEERAEHLRQRPRVWSLVKRLGYPLLGYRDAIAMADAMHTLNGTNALDYLSTLLALNSDTDGVAHIPPSGTTIVIANHPAGIADGVAVYDAVKSRRRDITFFANRDAVRAVPGLADNIIPVEWMAARRTRSRTRETVRRMTAAFRDERLVVIFPSGRIARPTWRGLREQPWQASAVNLASRYHCPVVPLRITARNSWLFYFLYLLNDELRDITLFNELLNKTGYPYRLRFAAPFEIASTAEPDAITRALQQFVSTDLRDTRSRLIHPAIRYAEEDPTSTRR